MDVQSRNSDLQCSVHTIAKVNDTNYIWQVKDKRRLIMRPRKAMDDTHRNPRQELDKNMWHADAIYAQFFSQEGVTFTLTVNFTEEEAMRENRRNLKANPKSNKQVRTGYQ